MARLLWKVTTGNVRQTVSPPGRKSHAIGKPIINMSNRETSVKSSMTLEAPSLDMLSRHRFTQSLPQDSEKSQEVCPIKSFTNPNHSREQRHIFITSPDQCGKAAAPKLHAQGSYPQELPTGPTLHPIASSDIHITPPLSPSLIRPPQTAPLKSENPTGAGDPQASDHTHSNSHLRNL